MSQRLDIILFGATGLTGKNCIQYLHQLTKSNERSLTWGIAGRCKEKLVQIQKECSKSIGESLKDVPIFIADVNDGESLNKMTASAKVLINCIGPYQLYGEAVVLACLETCTHHIDVSGEPYYMENIYYKYNRLAKERGIYIISACGYDSVPADLGVVFMQQNFEGINKMRKSKSSCATNGSVNNEVIVTHPKCVGLFLYSTVLQFKNLKKRLNFEEV